MAARAPMAGGAKGHWPPRVALALRPGGRPCSGVAISLLRGEKKVIIVDEGHTPRHVYDLGHGVSSLSQQSLSKGMSA